MSRLATSFVLGYHGCDRAVARQAVDGDTELLQSDRNYDWLGSGIYFWEADPQRAIEWAQWKVDRKEYREAAVVGAVIDLRHCLDLLSRENLELIAAAYRSFEALQRTAGLPVPVNRGAGDSSDDDRSLRFLDCAVIRHLHTMLAEQAATGRRSTHSTLFEACSSKADRFIREAAFARRRMFRSPCATRRASRGYSCRADR